MTYTGVLRQRGHLFTGSNDPWHIELMQVLGTDKEYVSTHANLRLYACHYCGAIPDLTVTDGVAQPSTRCTKGPNV